MALMVLARSPARHAETSVRDVSEGREDVGFGRGGLGPACHDASGTNPCLGRLLFWLSN